MTNKDEISMERMLTRVIHPRRTAKNIIHSFFKQSNLHSGVCMYEELCCEVRSAITMSFSINTERLIMEISDRIHSDHSTNQLLQTYVLPRNINAFMID